MAKRKPEGADTPLLEWLVGGAGALIFAAIVAILLTNALTDPGAPPSIVVEVERIVPAERGYVVEFIARNVGDKTAAMVEITGELGVETRHATLDYLPPRSERAGGLFFENDPRPGGLTLRAEGYQDP